MSEEKAIVNNLDEESRVGNLVAECLTGADTTNETVVNVLFNLLLVTIEEGNVQGSVASDKVTLTISRPNEDNDNG